MVDRVSGPAGRVTRENEGTRMNLQIDEQDEVATAEAVADRNLGRRTFVAAATGVGLASILGIGVAFAQDDDDDDETDDTDMDDVFDDDADEINQIGEGYQNFLGKLTKNLGLPDSATVDLAIRDALKAMVDEKFADGSISKNDADALKDRIDTGASPLGVAMLGGIAGRGRERRPSAAPRPQVMIPVKELEATRHRSTPHPLSDPFARVTAGQTR